ncbi:MAG: hypothetical protein IJT15_02285 [Rickettsiales bacterium]|nr:hypothetical protein [Rickettsiales bacterium]
MKRYSFIFAFFLLCISNYVRAEMAIKHTGSVSFGYGFDFHRTNRGVNNYIQVSGEYDIIFYKNSRKYNPFIGVSFNGNIISICALNFSNSFDVRYSNLFNFDIKAGMQFLIYRLVTLEVYMFTGLNIGSRTYYIDIVKYGIFNKKTLLAGVTAGIGMDFIIHSHFLVGLYYRYGNLIRHNNLRSTTDIEHSNLIGIKIGYKF